MKRLRICFRKGEGVKFISHLDLVRTFIRALRRARFPLAYSGGYNPQPRLAFAAALPVGITSSCEYLDVYLTRQIDLGLVTETLNQYLPEGIEIQMADYVKFNAPALMKEIDTAVYCVSAPEFRQIAIPQWTAVIEKILKSREIVVERRGKKKAKPVNLRPFIFSIQLIKEGQKVTGLKLFLQTGNKGGARPTELLAVFRDNGLPLDPFNCWINREGLFIRRNRDLRPPLQGIPSIKLPKIKEVG